MSASEITAVTLALLVSALAPLVLVYRYRWLDADRRALHFRTEAETATRHLREASEVMRGVASGPVRHQIRLATHEGAEGDLPPFRWEVLDADRWVKSHLRDGESFVGDEDHPFMVGNEESATLALACAMSWLNEQGVETDEVVW